ncbi:hypothetical protein GCM10009765_78960 [Fodinicola feengrottensis]|uniref:Luciferase-like domain-containing protein n=1 Tax=Fodinicola feengrottensis TaxID=435914 RepID=A0ABP4VB01_9ACTN
MPTKFAVYLPPFGPLADPNALVEVARRAEAAGWDGVFLWDHVLADGPVEVTDPWVALGAMAAATSRVLLGTMVSPLPRHRPAVVARQAGTLSRLSGGRCVLGVGLGADEYGDFTRFGEPTGLAGRAAMADEALSIIQALWSGQPYVHAGTHFCADLPQTHPEPHRIPIWVAGTLPGLGSAARAVRHDGVFLLGENLTVTPEEVRRALAVLAVNDRPFDVVLAGNASPAWENPTVPDLRPLADAGMTWWAESFVHYDPLDLTLTVIDAGPPRF